MRILVGLVATALLFVVTVRAEAQQGPVLVELFTSQGCASCPPADRMLGALAERDDVIALSLHVDYWDYIGWEDSFADPAFTRRQKAYARAWQRSSVYTPQIIVGGSEEVTDLRRWDPRDAVARLAAANPVVHLSLSAVAEEQIGIRATADPPLTREVAVMLARYIPSATVEIKSGENSGRSLTYHNIVTSLEEVARWDGASALEITISAPGGTPAVVFIQERGQGKVLAVARQR